MEIGAPRTGVCRPGRGHESGKSAAGPRFIGVHSPAMARLSFSSFAVLPLVMSVACAQPRASAQPTAGAQSTEGAASSSTSQSAQQRPTLIVMLTIDQMRPDYLTLWENQFNGGLARLLRGAVYLNGFQDHANTETAPGHASTLSGRFPRSTGIVSNVEGVYDNQSQLIGAPGDPASPYRFRGSTLIDWMRSANPAAKALSVSRKDRGAILPIGTSKQSVFWYARSRGIFTTSRYYGDSLPTWVQSFNARRLPHAWAGRSWDLLLDASQYQEIDSAPHESGGLDYTFPHVLPSDPAAAAAGFPSVPFMDQLTLSFALEGVRQMKLGEGAGTDLLAVSLSTTDAIGHQYGPDSREVHDQIVRLDRYLGAFFDTLFTLRDSTRIVIAFTSDHSVTPLPSSKSRYPNQGAGKVNIRPAVVPLFASLRAAGVDTGSFRFDDDGILYLDEASLTRRGLRLDAVARTFATEVMKVPGVLRVDRVASLATKDTTTDYVARRWLHMLPPDRNAAAVVTLKPYWYWTGVNFATHGSPHDSDAHVPIIFYGAGIKSGRHTKKVNVVDIAPTLAEIIGVRPTEPRLDGRPLRDAIKP
jgi:predicted AlkP superfamily pyrophosphatase or phosphodiesterase